ncbi:MAG: nicotinate (nicotinamide) nucleotide adenylyltransferase [Planctomycetota bacterium]|jgi:nicotinate-nucleotide adenylyltransferase
MSERKIALFGGTFDPIHRGHTAVASAAAEYIGAEKVIFIPAKRSPLKQSQPIAGEKQRLEMITLAIADNQKFAASDVEIKKPRPSYTIETVRYFQNKYGGGAVIYWLAGADSIDELPLWYGITELIDECNLSVMYRGGFDRPDFSRFAKLWGDDRVGKLNSSVIETPLVDISSTQIRNRLAGGGNADDMLYRPVAEYIRQCGLYRSPLRNAAADSASH